MTQQSKVREILQQLQYGTTMSENQEPMLTNNRDIAEQALYDAMREVIKPKNAIDRFTRLNALFGKKGE